MKSGGWFRLLSSVTTQVGLFSNNLPWEQRNSETPSPVHLILSLTLPGEDIAFRRKSFCIFLSSSACCLVLSLFLMLTSFLHILNGNEKINCFHQTSNNSQAPTVKLNVNLWQHCRPSQSFPNKIEMFHSSIRNAFN